MLADVLDNADDSPPSRCRPVRVLQRQIEQTAGARDLVVMIGSELELFAYDAGYDELARNHYRDLGQRTSSWYNLDYHVLQTTKDEPLIRALRNGMVAAACRWSSPRRPLPGQHEAQPPVLRRADHGRQPHRVQERRQGDRPPAGQRRSRSWPNPASTSRDRAATSTRRSGARRSTARPGSGGDADRFGMSSVQGLDGRHPGPFPELSAVPRRSSTPTSGTRRVIVGPDRSCGRPTTRRAVWCLVGHGLRCASSPASRGGLQPLHRLRCDHRRRTRRDRPRPRLR